MSNSPSQSDIVLPLAAYGVLGISAVTAQFALSQSLIFVAAAGLVLHVTEVHNAWDAIMYFVLVRPQQEG